MKKRKKGSSQFESDESWLRFLERKSKAEEAVLVVSTGIMLLLIVCVVYAANTGLI